MAMASHFQIQKPYVLTTLPRPLDPTTGRYVVGEVYGSQPGSRKRKRRPELVVSSDGEAVNIIDVSSARLLTSYPIPPESRITCPITSIRKRTHEGSREVVRYTYASIQDSRNHKITLFKDHVEASGNTTSSVTSVSLGEGSPVVCLAPTSLSASESTTSDTAQEYVFAVRENGEIISFDAITLEKKSTSKPSLMQQELVGTSKTNFKVDFCRLVPITEVVKGIFRGNSSETSGLFSSSTSAQIDDGDVFVLVSSSGSVEQPMRHLHILGMLPSSASASHTQQSIVQLHFMPMTAVPAQEERESIFRLDARNGTILELRDQTLSTHDLTAGVPKVTSTMEIEGAMSLLNLSKTSLLCSTNSQLHVVNPVFSSLQDTVDIDLEGQAQAAGENHQSSMHCSLVAYFSPLELAVAIVGSNLVAIQLEIPKARNAKRRAEGLLIDSIGRGLHTDKRTSSHASLISSLPKHSVFSKYIPGTVRGEYWTTWTADASKADGLLEANQIYELDLFLAEKFGIQTNATAATNGTDSEGSTKVFASWDWPKSRATYPPVDRRWILYAIGRAFQWNNVFPDDATIPRLICQLPQSNIINYLVDAGHLTLSNVKAALRVKLTEEEKEDSFLAEQLIARLADLDPSLEQLVTYLSATDLGSVELLLVVRTIMRSLELVQDPRKPPPKLIGFGSTEEVASQDYATETENIGMELDDLEDEIQKTISYLDEDAHVRGHGLTVAFNRLGSCPRVSMIKALQSTFKPEEILSLVYLLRVELTKGGWTSRYLDDTDFEKDAPFDPPPDGSVKLIADLLGRCVDAIGPGGWLLNDAILAGEDSGGFIDRFHLEVSVALEGLNEAACLRGLVGDVVKFSETLGKTAIVPKEDMGKLKPISVQVGTPGSDALPLGLKPAAQRISKQKVVSGGEVVKRSAREVGHLIGQQVGSYSLERIAI
ncbi:hypothetical protein F5Y15DRAFT_137225 [Xylariaceae sp. FL0016]|nr:hypothetical protein F5Y15DRAFT_137225 [Xylariaceae sp. FL0016]